MTYIFIRQNLFSKFGKVRLVRKLICRKPRYTVILAQIITNLTNITNFFEKNKSKKFLCCFPLYILILLLYIIFSIFLVRLVRNR